MSKVCIILNARKTDDMSERLASLYPDGTEWYAVQLKEGFSKEVTPDTTEILFGGGTSFRLKENIELKNEIFNFVLQTKLPIIGICFGMQLIARAYGSRVVQLPRESEGLKNIRIIREKADFSNKYIAQIYKKQSWSLQDLPSDFSIYAISDDGIEAFLHANKPIAGMQFHPEQFGQVSDGQLIFTILRQKMLDRV